VPTSNPVFRWLVSPANWCGLGLASTALVLQGLGLLGSAGLWVAALGYGAGYGAGGMWFGFPRWRRPTWEALEFSDEGNVREAMDIALNGVRQLTRHNPNDRLPTALKQQVLVLCDELAALLKQWERSRGQLSLEEGFAARRIAITYLPEALNAYLSIPDAFARGKVLANGKTAQQTFADTLSELQAKVRQLADDLAAQDAQAFLTHSQFLTQKFGQHPPAALLQVPHLSDKEPRR